MLLSAFLWCTLYGLGLLMAFVVAAVAVLEDFISPSQYPMFKLGTLLE